MPRASIIIPAYNAAEYIGTTLDSILTQTFKDFECIIVDDGSTDNTIETVKSYSDRRIKLIEQENSGGPAKPRNVGISCASGDYIFMFDSDDLMAPNKLEISINALDANPSADFLFTNFSSIDEHGDDIKSDFLEEYDTLWSLCGGRPPERAVVEIASADIYAALIKINFIGTSSVVLRRSALTNENKFDESLSNSDDRLFWILFTKAHHAVFVNDRLHQYRHRHGSISSQGFIRRGPNKIRALLTAQDNCEDVALKKILTKHVANDYANLAYAYRVNKDFRNQIKFAYQSLRVRVNGKAFRLLTQGCFKYMVGR